MTFSSSNVPSPKCIATGCGTLCTGYYCNPVPTGPPPCFRDPKDPNNDRVWPTTSIPGNTLPPGGSTTTKPPDPPTVTTQQPPKPTPSLGRVVFALRELFTSSDGGMGDWSRSWTVHGLGLEGNYDRCDNSPVWQRVTFRETSQDVHYPPDLGPFTVHGLTCQYEGTLETLGTMRCEGAKAVECFQMRKANPCGVPQNPMLIQTMVCRV